MRDLKKYLKQQFGVMFQQKGFIFSLFFMLCLVLASYISCVISLEGTDRFSSSSWECQCVLYYDNSASLYSVFLTAYPFIILFPYAFSIFKEKQIKMRDLHLSRVKAWKYYAAKSAVCFSGAFIILFLPLLINILMCYATFDGRLMTAHGEGGYMTEGYLSHFKNMPLPGLYLKSRLLYYILWAAYVAVLGGIFSIFAMALSTFVKKYMVFLLLPVYLLMELLVRLQTGRLCMDINNYLSIGFMIRNRSAGFLLAVILAVLCISVLCIVHDRKKEVL